jgi:predicted transcriptional regulator
MATLGELEKSVMDVLWESGDELSATDIRDRLSAHKDNALTTVMTVLSRLERKGFVSRDRGQRPHHYRAVSSREHHMAELMHDVLGSSPDRAAVLARFISTASEAEAATLRRLLERN